MHVLAPNIIPDVFGTPALFKSAFGTGRIPCTTPSGSSASQTISIDVGAVDSTRSGN